MTSSEYGSCQPELLTAASKGSALLLKATNRDFLSLAAFALFVIFAILAIRLFGNKLYACNDSSITTGREDCFGSFIAPNTGILMPRVWDRPDYNFDSLGKVSLMQVLTAVFF